MGVIENMKDIADLIHLATCVCALKVHSSSILAGSTLVKSGNHPCGYPDPLVREARLSGPKRSP